VHARPGHASWQDAAALDAAPDGRANVFGVDQLDPICPWSDVEAAGLTEVESHRPGIVQPGEDPLDPIRWEHHR